MSKSSKCCKAVYNKMLMFSSALVAGIGLAWLWLKSILVWELPFGNRRALVVSESSKRCKAVHNKLMLLGATFWGAIIMPWIYLKFLMWGESPFRTNDGIAPIFLMFLGGLLCIGLFVYTNRALGFGVTKLHHFAWLFAPWWGFVAIDLSSSFRNSAFRLSSGPTEVNLGVTIAVVVCIGVLNFTSACRSIHPEMRWISGGTVLGASLAVVVLVVVMLGLGGPLLSSVHPMFALILVFLPILVSLPIGMVKYRRAVPFFVNILRRSESPRESREAAAWLIQLILGDRMRAAWGWCAHDRWASPTGEAEFAVREAISVLADRCDDPDPTVRTHVKLALSLIEVNTHPTAS